MLYQDMFKEKHDVEDIAGLIKSIGPMDINIMEVCGTHTMAIAQNGLKEILPNNIRLISGPGCPVCVTPAERIDDICSLSKYKNIIIATYGDMLRVPGTRREISLERSRMDGADVRIVYSSMDALKIAKENKNMQVVFLGVGFETTAPATAAAVLEAFEDNIDNFSVFSIHKLIGPAMRSLLDAKEVRIDGFLLPGHVAVIVGERGFGFLAKDYHIPGVISGFEPVDIMDAVLMITMQIARGSAEVENEYTRLVKKNGNIAAQKVIDEIFDTCDDLWRGLGMIKSSSLKLKRKYSKFDAALKFGIEYSFEQKPSACRCGDVLKGLIEPEGCNMFGRECTPDYPVGPCMVSSEGACAAAYKYM